MADKPDYPGYWRLFAGIVFAIAFILMVNISTQQIEFYYFEEGKWLYENGNYEEATRSEWCDADDRMDPANCNSWKFNTHISVVLTLLPLGFTLMCLGRPYVRNLDIALSYEKEFEEE